MLNDENGNIVRNLKNAPRKVGYTPEQFTKSGTEQGHQTALFLWAQQNRAQFPELAILFAIPNGGLRDKITAGRMRAAGVKAGVPDICLPVARGGFHGLWVELKRPKSDGKAKGRASAVQSPWIAELRGQGHAAVVCYGYDEARTAICEYLALDGSILLRNLFSEKYE